jgi:hypothetical protein
MAEITGVVYSFTKKTMVAVTKNFRMFFCKWALDAQ